MNKNTNTERLSAEALAEIELSLDSIRLIPRTQRTISANAKIFGHAAALLASHRALEADNAELRMENMGLSSDARTDWLTMRNDELEAELAKAREQLELMNYQRIDAMAQTTAAPRQPGELAAMAEWINELSERVAALEAGTLEPLALQVAGDDPDAWEYVEVAVRYPDKRAKYEAQGYVVTLPFGTEQGAHLLMRRPRQDGDSGDGE